jgi:hypothetical protein
MAEPAQPALRALTVLPRRFSDDMLHEGAMAAAASADARRDGGGARGADADVVANTNRVLALAGLAATAHTLADALAVCGGTSLFVAAVEACLGHRLEGARPSRGGRAAGSVQPGAARARARAGCAPAGGD